MRVSAIRKKAGQYPVPFACAAIALLSLGLYLMRGPKLAEYEAELARLEREWQNIQTNLDRSPGIEQDIAALEAGVEQLRARLMRVEDVAVNYEFFYDLERAAGVRLGQFTQGTASDGAGLPIGRANLLHFSVIPYDFVMSGSLAQILGFIELLDRQRHIVRIDLLNVSRPLEATAGADQLTARLRCHVLAAKYE